MFCADRLENGTHYESGVGQMDMCVRMYDETVCSKNDNPTISIVLCSDTDEDIARYSILKENEQIFATKYKLYLPTEEELRLEIELQKELLQLQLKINGNYSKFELKTTSKQKVERTTIMAKKSASTKGDVSEKEEPISIRLFTFCVALRYETSKWRDIAIAENNNFESFHDCIYDAFERYEEHMWSFLSRQGAKKP